MAQLIDLKVGFSCNNNCIHCVISDKTKEKDLSLEQIKELVNGYIEQYGEIQLTLTGGEVTIRKDFIQLMDYVKEKKSEGKITFADMQTNARMLSHNDCAMAAEAIDFFLVAIHSSIPAIHDTITGANGSFEQTKQAIINLKKYAGSDRIATQTVINQMNIGHLPDVYKFIVEDLGLSECNITFPHPIGVCLSDKIVPTYEYAQFFINESLDYCLKHNIQPYIEAIPFCVWNPGMNRQYAIEFLKKRSIDVIGYSGEKDGTVDYASLFDEGHRKYDTCKKCPYFSVCEGVWKEHLLIYPNEDMYKLYLKGVDE
jgi:MoaA/NifB/PqqE/SkfB family radical SAM enzyme